MRRVGIVPVVILAACKLFNNIFSRFRATNSEKLVGLLSLESKGVITYSNHISTVDDPLMWGIVPIKHMLCSSTRSKRCRWSLGAKELVFTNPIFSWFFSAGMVIPVERGLGINQEGMAKAKSLLCSGEWVHVFPEGKVADTAMAINLPLRWGLADLVLDYHQQTGTTPIIVPIVIKGTGTLQCPFLC